MDLSLATGYPKNSAAAGTFKKSEVFALAKALLAPFKLAAFTLEKRKISAVLQFPLYKITGKSPHKTQNDKQQSKPAE